MPDAFASIWGTWAPTGGAPEGLSTGLRLRHTGEKWNGTDAQRTPSNTLFDGRIAYRWDRYEAALNVTNIEDERHMSFCGVSECYFGEAREISVSLSARF